MRIKQVAQHLAQSSLPPMHATEGEIGACEYLGSTKGASFMALKNILFSLRGAIPQPTEANCRASSA